MLSKYISLPEFLISFSIGLFFIYIIGPETKKVYIYPTPESVDKMLYKDKANNCFSFKQKEVDCKNAKKDLFDIPIQE